MVPSRPIGGPYPKPPAQRSLEPVLSRTEWVLDQTGKDDLKFEVGKNKSSRYKLLSILNFIQYRTDVTGQLNKHNVCIFVLVSTFTLI